MLETFDDLPEADKPPCKHPDFNATIVINKMPDVKRFVMDLTCSCKECGEPFVFLGLPVGIDLKTASVSIDGTEARLSIAPISSAEKNKELCMTFKKEGEGDAKKSS